MTNSNLNQLPDLMAATQALAENLLASEPFAVYQQASARFNADPHARGLIERLSQTQADLRRRQTSRGVTQADVDQLRALQREVQSHPVIIDYVVHAARRHHLSARDQSSHQRTHRHRFCRAGWQIELLTCWWDEP